MDRLGEVNVRLAGLEAIASEVLLLVIFARDSLPEDFVDDVPESFRLWLPLVLC